MDKDANVPFSQRYFDALIAGTASVQEVLPEITRAGEAVAERLVAGGELFIVSVRPDFVSEGFVRAGGLMLLKEHTPNVQLSEQDAVIFGWSNTTPEKDLAMLQQLHQTGALVVGVGPSPPTDIAQEFLTHVNLFMESLPPLPAAVTARFSGESYPLISLQNLIVLWTFTGEMVAALTRQGYMPTMYQSVLVPGARERNGEFHHQRFQDKHAVPSIPAEQLGQTYLEELSQCLRAVREEEIAAIETVARVCTEVRTNGHHVYAALISHFPVYQLGAPGDPKFMQSLERLSGETPQVAELERKLQPGDLFFFLGYYRRPAEAYEIARRAQALIVEIIGSTPSIDHHPPDHTIQPRWPFGDALVPVPNYDIKILPSSGILQTAIYWAVVGSMYG